MRVSKRFRGAAKVEIKRLREQVSVKDSGQTTYVTWTGHHRANDIVEVFFSGGVYHTSYKPSKHASAVTGRATTKDGAIQWATNILRQYKDWTPLPKLTERAKHILMTIYRQGGSTTMTPAGIEASQELVKSKIATTKGNTVTLTNYGKELGKTHF